MTTYKTATALGQALKAARQAQKMTQKQLAAGLCAQSLISALEAGDYLPNAVLFAQLCERLKLPLDSALLAHYPGVQAPGEFNVKVRQLCDQHAYQQLATYLEQADVQAQLITDADLAVFYYYRGIAAFQSHQPIEAAQQDLNLALTMAPISLKFLILSVQGFAAMYTGQLKRGRQVFQQALVAMQALPAYDENQQCVYYQQGLSEFQVGNFDAAQVALTTGIQLATDHGSHYLLADLLQLSAACAEQQHQPDQAVQARQQSRALQQLFHIQTYQFEDA